MTIYEKLQLRRESAKGGPNFHITEDQCNIMDEMYLKNCSDYEIGRATNISSERIHYLRKILGLPKAKIYKSQNHFELEKNEIEIIFGTLLGDASLTKSYDRHPSIRFTFTHCKEQKGFFDYKSNLLERIKGLSKDSSVLDKRTNNIYYFSTFTSFSHPIFNALRDVFYPFGKKIIPIEHLENNYSVRSLAIHFMDDGYKSSNRSWYLCTDGFESKNVEEFCEFLNIKFGLVTRRTKSNRVLISYKCASKFKELITPYICESMKYKI